MKKLFVLLISIVLIAGVYTISYGNGNGLGIVGSPHDFTDGLVKGAALSEAWNSRAEICRVCHVPHDHGVAAKNYMNGLLWNHGVSSATYTMYNNAWSSTLTGTQSAQPDGTAKLCLSCHDGTVALDTYDKYTNTTTYIDSVGYDAGFKTPGFLDGANLDLRGTHPLSIAFPAGQDGDGINFNSTAATNWANGATIASTLDNGKVQCSTCHEVHNKGSVAGTHLLRSPQTVAQGGTASELCLKCHIK